MIMPDHVHLFVRGDHGLFFQVVSGLTASDLVAVMKQRLWQPGSLSHTPDNESYAKSGNYVRENPVRAGLCITYKWHTRAEIVVNRSSVTSPEWQACRHAGFQNAADTAALQGCGSTRILFVQRSALR